MLSDERVSSGDDWRGAYKSDGILIATVPRPTQRASSKTRALRFTHWRMNSSCRGCFRIQERHSSGRNTFVPPRRMALVPRTSFGQSRRRLLIDQ